MKNLNLRYYNTIVFVAIMEFVGIRSKNGLKKLGALFKSLFISNKYIQSHLYLHKSLKITCQLATTK